MAIAIPDPSAVVAFISAYVAIATTKPNSPLARNAASLRSAIAAMSAVLPIYRGIVDIVLTPREKSTAFATQRHHPLSTPVLQSRDLHHLRISRDTRRRAIMVAILLSIHQTSLQPSPPPETAPSSIITTSMPNGLST